MRSWSRLFLLALLLSACDSTGPTPTPSSTPPPSGRVLQAEGGFTITTLDGEVRFNLAPLEAPKTIEASITWTPPPPAAECVLSVFRIAFDTPLSDPRCTVFQGACTILVPDGSDNTPGKTSRLVRFRGAAGEQHWYRIQCTSPQVASSSGTYRVYYISD